MLRLLMKEPVGRKCRTGSRLLLWLNRSSPKCSCCATDTPSRLATVGRISTWPPVPLMTDGSALPGEWTMNGMLNISV
ncbi:hypothetical protein D3C76_1631850 [compost metagenome]